MKLKQEQKTDELSDTVFWTMNGKKANSALKATDSRAMSSGEGATEKHKPLCRTDQECVAACNWMQWP